MSSFRFARLRAFGGVLLAVAAGCVDGALSPEGTGSLVVHLVQGSVPHDDQRAVGKADSVGYATVLRVSGPTSKTQQLTFDGNSYVGTVTGLVPGSYEVIIEGLANGQVDHFGKTAGVQIAAGSTTSANIVFGSFVPVAAPLSARTVSVVVPVTFSAVPNATGYEMQWAMDPAFTNVLSVVITGTSVVIVFTEPGVHWIRVRAMSPDVANGRFSAPQTTEILTDTLASGDDATSAADLGFSPVVTLAGLNVLPTGDQDWFGAELCGGDTLVAETYAGRLVPPSPLNSVLAIRDTTGTALATNDDSSGTDSYVEAVAPADGRLFIVVSGTAATLGHYELSVDVRRGPNNTGAGCTVPAGPA